MLKNLFNIIKPGNTLYYPGCLTKFVFPDIQQNYEKILRKIGVDFIMLESEEVCCGSPALRAGYQEDFDSLKQENLEKFKKYGIKKMITNCPACYSIFSKQYDFESEHITQTIAKNLSKLKPNNKPEQLEISYHDPCHLGRYSKVYDEPRLILKHLGFEIVELYKHHQESYCCGAGGGLKTNDPELANKIGQDLVKEIPTEQIVSTCPLCYAQLKENAPTKKVWELSELIINLCFKLNA